MSLTTEQAAMLENELLNVQQEAAPVLLQGRITQTKDMLLSAIQPYISFIPELLAYTNLCALSRVDLNSVLERFNNSIQTHHSLGLKVSQINATILTLVNCEEREKSNLKQAIQEIIWSTQSKDEHGHSHEWLLEDEAIELTNSIAQVHMRLINKNNIKYSSRHQSTDGVRHALEDVTQNGFFAKFVSNFVSNSDRVSWAELCIEMTAGERARFDDIRQQLDNRMNTPLRSKLLPEQQEALKLSIESNKELDEAASRRIDLNPRRIEFLLGCVEHSILSAVELNLLDEQLAQLNIKDASEEDLRRVLQQINKILKPFIPQRPQDLPFELHDHFFNFHRDRVLIIASRIRCAIHDIHERLMRAESSLHMHKCVLEREHQFNQTMQSMCDGISDAGINSTSSPEHEIEVGVLVSSYQVETVEDPNDPLLPTNAMDGKKHQLVNRLSDAIAQLQAELDSTMTQQIDPYVLALQQLVQEFSDDKIDLAHFRQQSEAIFQDKDLNALKNSDSFLSQVYTALVFLFRSFFRVFDLIITGITGAKHTMAADPHRISFFEYPVTPLSKQMATLSNAFTQAVVELNNLTQSSSTDSLSIG